MVSPEMADASSCSGCDTHGCLNVEYILTRHGRLLFASEPFDATLGEIGFDTHQPVKLKPNAAFAGVSPDELMERRKTILEDYFNVASMANLSRV
jgi:hypothetical protein